MGLFRSSGGKDDCRGQIRYDGGSLIIDCSRCEGVRICWATATMSCTVGAGRSSMSRLPLTRRIGGEATFRCRSLAPRVIICLRMLLISRDTGPLLAEIDAAA